ncbi:MAG: diguanylate cyclase [Neomegalonema sp.]|nr:diguanylate cyclase [Neomegalonema sp.]
MNNLKKNKSNRLLLVEDSVSFSYCIKAKLEKEIDAEIVLARSLAEAQDAIRIFEGQFFLALLDLTLPDSADGEIVSLATEHGIASVVFTGSYSDDLRDRMFELGAIEYLIKDNPNSLNYVVSMVRRLRANTQTQALVVDDSKTSRLQIVELLKKYQFQILEAANGVDALRVLDQNKNIQLVVTDFNMPQMNGCELTKAIRMKYGPERLAIIGLSAQGCGPLSAKFLKYGANDFLNKPFLQEEFFCRLTQNMDRLDSLRALTEAAMRDYLTGLFNRRHFFEIVNTRFARAEEGEFQCTIAMVDLDHFKDINDSHGHIVGDKAIQHVARIIADEFGGETDIVARVGGEEFCIFLQGVDQQNADFMLEELRRRIEVTPFEHKDEEIAVTASIGVMSACDVPPAAMVDEADRALYTAKRGGRNQVVFARGEAFGQESVGLGA